MLSIIKCYHTTRQVLYQTYQIKQLHFSTNTQIVLVPSQRDAHADYVYPQPPYKLPEKDAWNKIPQHKDLKVLQYCHLLIKHSLSVNHYSDSYPVTVIL